MLRKNYPKASLTIALVLIAGFAGRAGGQPTDLNVCIEQRGPIPYCTEARTGGITYLDCNRSFAFFRGRIAWYPLRCVGPITIEINAAAHVHNRFPLYVEILPMGNTPCLDPGYHVMTVNGGFECDPWETIGPLDITTFVPLGSSYAIQIVFFDTGDGDLESPGVDCLRVTPNPIESSVDLATWGHVKLLYRE